MYTNSNSRSFKNISYDKDLTIMYQENEMGRFFNLTKRDSDGNIDLEIEYSDMKGYIEEKVCLDYNFYFPEVDSQDPIEFLEALIVQEELEFKKKFVSFLTPLNKF